MNPLQRLTRGSLSILGVLLHPLGRFTGRLLNDLRAPSRLERGLVIVLPGIEGESCINHSIARGLADGGVESAIEIFDWTTGFILLFPYHLRGWRRNISQAERLVQRIVEYRMAHPGCPVHLVGHSGGGAMTILTLERLPPETRVTSRRSLAGGNFSPLRSVDGTRASNMGSGIFDRLSTSYSMGSGRAFWGRWMADIPPRPV